MYVSMSTQSKKVPRDEESSTKRRKSKTQQQQSRFRSLREDELQGPPSRTRASLKRRIHEPSSTKLPAKKKLNHEDRSKNHDKTSFEPPIENSQTDISAPDTEEPSGAPSITQPLPDKQTLELIIDTLQRKDIYEIFAEPVDPEEVADYYEIIDEPMDFGTMRAKLHEGLYTSLGQFEHDVYLISGNAMHFNSSGTIFFRQAHGIHKLAKRVFHVLRTNPENFESEFVGNRRRSCRKSQDETNELNRKQFFKSSEKSSTAAFDAYLKNTNSSIHGNFLKNFRLTRGDRESKQPDSSEVDPRSTYKPYLNLNNDNWSKSLIHLNQQQNSYNQSLMQFVKDLGPTAQLIANRKLQQTTINNFGNKFGNNFGQINENRFNSNRSELNDGRMKSGTIDTRNRIGMDSIVSLNSIHGLIRQQESESSISRELGFLKLKLGKKMNSEDTSCSSNNLFDDKYLRLQL